MVVGSGPGLLTQEGMVELPPLAGAISAVARSVSADGAVVGYSSYRRGFSDVEQATAWIGGVPHSLGNTPRGDCHRSFANAVSGDGTVIAGVGANPKGDTDAFVATLGR